MFKEIRSESMFSWDMLGDVNLGRPNLGPQVPVTVYRLMQFTLRDIMIKALGVEETDAIFYEAGFKAGLEFHRNVIQTQTTFNDFINETQATLKNLGIGILRVESADTESHRYTLTVSEDLDCSGLPITDEEICVYDEGFIAGLLKSQTKLDFSVREVDCWCSGDRVCRFEVTLKE